MFRIFGLRRYNFHVSPIIHIAIAAAVTLAGFAFVPLAAQTVVATVGAGSQPAGVTVNPATNKIYVTNYSSSNVTVIDGATNTTLTVSVGINPAAIAVNPSTDMVYVTNLGSNNVTVINGLTNASATVTVGSQPKALVVDEVTNQIYVANYGDKTVSVISGLTNAVVKTIMVGTNPVALVANPMTGHVYVANSGSASVMDIDEASNTVAGTITVGANPIALAFNPVTDQVYAANSSSNNISVIDGKTDSLVAMVSVGSSPTAVSVNPVTNTVYVANQTGNTVSVINGASNAVTANIAVANGPVALGVNSLTSQVYAVCNGSGSRVSVIDGTGNTVKATLTIGDGSLAIALNPVTNKAYVSSGTAGNVSVIDGTVNKVAASIGIGEAPVSIEVNPVTNSIYVASNNTGDGYWISGATNTITHTASSGSNLYQVHVNPATNFVYLENQDSVVVFDDTNAQVATIPTGFGVNAGMVLDPTRNTGYVAYDNNPTLFIINTLTNTIANTISLGAYPLYPRAIAFNPVTDTVYVVSSGITPTTGPNTLSVISGLTGTVVSIPVGRWPQGLAVNSVTNKIYVTNNNDGTVTVIDGTTNTVKTTLTVGSGAEAIVLNPITNKIYVANYSAANVSVIDGSNDTVSATVTVGSGPGFLAMDTVANLIYVSNTQGGSVSVIDGASDTVQAAYTVGSSPGAIAVNPTTGKGYVTDYFGEVYVLSPNVIQVVPFTTAISGVTDSQTLSTTNIFQTTNRSPSFTAAVTSAYTLSSVYSSVPAASDPAPTALYYAVDGASGSWANATESTAMGTNPGSFNLTLSGMTIGLHTLYVYPAYGNEGSPANGSGSGNSPEIGNLASYTFLVGPMATKTTVVADMNPQAPGGNVTFTATVAPVAEGAPVLTGTVSFYDGTTLLGTGMIALVGGSYQATCQTNSLSAGRHKITAAYFGDANYLGSTSPIQTEVIGQLTTTTLTITAGSPAVPVTTVATGTVVTLTSQVTIAGTTLTTGLVNFCDATAATCTDIHLLGTAQLTSAGTASIKLKPGIGSHSYKAVFVGTVATGDTTSTSDVSTLTVTGLFSTSTMISQSGGQGSYTLTATVVGVGGAMAPTPNVSFEDQTNSNYVLAAPALGTGTAELSFTNSSNPATGTSPQVVAVGDFNGDGIPDLATANGGDNTVSILLGNGDGTFTLKSSPATGLSPNSVAVGDFNGDGNADLATVNVNSNTVSILLGNGDGTFTVATSPTTDSGPFSIAVGDFNGDGKADISVANVASNTISILLGNGNGTFTAASPITTNSPFFVAVGDFNGDSIPDLVATNPNGGIATIFLGNGDGTFTAVPPLSTGGVPYSVAIGDFNGDGISDLAVANLSSNNITILLGEGDGTFALKSNLATDNNPTSVVVGDFNGDGKVDLAVATNIGLQEVTVLLGNGDGTFTSQSSIPAPNPEYIAVGDFNGDGIPDFAVTNPASSTVAVQLSQLTETVSATATGISPVGTGTHQVVAFYPGDANYSGSTSTPTDLTAQQVTTALALTATPANSNFGDSVTLIATLNPDAAQGHTTTGGTVTFYYGSISLGTGMLSSSGVVTLNVSTLPAGSDDLHAVYGGDPNFIGSTSNTLSYVVAALAPAAASVSAIAAPFGSTVGITITAIESGSSGDVTGGMVTFSVVAPATGSFSPATCTLTAVGTCTTTYVPTGTLAAGTYPNGITANFAAVGNYAATSGTSTLNISAIGATTATVSVVTTPYGSTTGATVTAMESGSAGLVTGGVVTFSVIAPATGSFNPATCALTVAGVCATTYTPTGMLAAGTYANDIKASFAAVGNYSATTGSNDLNISGVIPATAMVSAVTAPAGSTTGVTVTATESGTAGSATGGVVTFSVTAPATGSFSPATCTLSAAGTCTTTYTPTGTLAAGTYANDISASFVAVSNYSATTANSNLHISAIAATAATVSAVTATAGSTTGITVTATESGSAGVVTAGVVTFSVIAPATGSFSPATCTLSAAGTCTTTYTPTGILAAGTYVNDIKASFAAVGSYTATSGNNNLSILTGPITHFTVTAPATATAGTAFNVTVTALDDYGNAITGYTGTIHFTSTDGAVILPADILLTNGAGTFPVTLKTSGLQTITVTDTVTSTLTGISGTIIVSAGAATHFSVSAPSTATANTPISVSVTALDTNNNIVSNYTGTAHFTSTDAAATLPANSTLTSGVGTFTATLKTIGQQTITATDTATNSLTGTSVTITVSAGTVTHFTVTAPTTATAGMSFTGTVLALDVGGNTVTGYSGTVHFTSTDGAAVLPANVILTNGVGTFTTILKTIGPQTITTTDTVTGSVTGTSGTITVSAGVATHFTVSAPSTATAGTSFSVSVTALDAYGNTTTSYAGTLHFTSTDGAALLPANVTLTNGVGSFSAMLKTAGPQTITATDIVTSSITGTSGTITVSAGATTRFTVSAPSTATAGTSFNVSVTALDAYGNTITSYADMVHFTSTDGVAVLPANVALTNGIGTFPATLKTAGPQIITAIDTVTSSITGTSGPIAVSVGAATYFTVSAPTTAIAGTAISVSVTALDAYGNTATNYTGTAHFTSTDAPSTLPLNATLINGIGTFSTTLKTSGPQTVTATDIATSSITGTSGTVTVTAGAVTHLAVAAPATATGNTSFNFAVTALDANGNTVTGYADIVHFSSTDGAATLPGNSALSTGTGNFAATLQTGGPQTITATGVTASSISGSASINVTGVVPVITFTVPNHTYGDAPFPISATSTSNGTLTYSVVSGPATIAGNTVTLTGAGTVVLQVSQPVAGNYAAATQVPTFMVAKATPVVTWPEPASIAYGTALSGTQLNATVTGVGGATLAGNTVYTPSAGTFLMPPGQTLSLLFTPADTTDYTTATATVSPAVTNGVLTLIANNATRVYGMANLTFTGSITGQQNGDTFAESFSTTAVQLSPVASYPIVPSASGANLSDYTQNVQNGTLTITQAATSATLIVGTVNAIAGQNNTFTAAITSLTSGTPTGTVQYLDNGSPFGSATLVAGQAVLTSAALGVGTHTVTILYSGDVNFFPNSASGSTSTITVTPPDFTFTATSDTAVAMPFGNTASFTFHLAPLSGNYYQAVSFSYSGDLPLAAKVSFSPNTVAVDVGPTDVTFSVITSKSLSMNHTSSEVGGTLFAFFMLPLAFLRRLRKSRKIMPRIAAFGVLLLLSAGAAIGLTGCGSGFADATYPITVTAKSGGVIHTATVTVHILHTPQ